MECQEMVSKLKEVAEGTATTVLEERAQVNKEQKGRNTNTAEGMTKTYVDRVKRGIPSIHNTAIARVETQCRKIRLIKAMGMVGEGMDELSEKHLVENVRG